MTEAVQVALIVGVSGAVTSLIGSAAGIAITLLKSRAQAKGHKAHEDVSAANNSFVADTNSIVKRIEIAVNGSLDERITTAIKEALGR